MKTELAAHAGFCFGVKRSLELVEEQLEKSDGPLYTWGPMIHNRTVTGELEQRGVHAVNSLEELQGVKKGTIVIRSHGISEETQRALEKTGLTVIDGTCPFVKKIHGIAADASNQGKQVVVIGNASHPEVEGICGWCKNRPAVVVSGPEEAEKLIFSEGDTLCIVSQTTNNSGNFKEAVEIITEKGYDIEVHNSICQATKERQESASVLSARVQAMIVIGDPNSSNSRKLYEICRERCNNTYFIQTKEELLDSDFACFDYVGITAGASTPNKLIEEVQNYVRKKF